MASILMTEEELKHDAMAIDSQKHDSRRPKATTLLLPARGETSVAAVEEVAQVPSERTIVQVHNREPIVVPHKEIPKKDPWSLSASLEERYRLSMGLSEQERKVIQDQMELGRGGGYF